MTIKEKIAELETQLAILKQCQGEEMPEMFDDEETIDLMAAGVDGSDMWMYD